MKKLLMILFFLLVGTTAGYCNTPKFKIHILKDSGLIGSNYSINYPVVIDYDSDGDQDILFISKEGTIYILENITEVA